MPFQQPLDSNYRPIAGPSDGQKPTYIASITGLVVAASATDIFTVTPGSAPVRITRLRISGTKTTAGADVDIQLIKRSAADTGGTSTAPTKVAYDSADTASTAAIAAYTVNPTGLGTAIGTLTVDSVFVGLATAQTGILDHRFGDRPAKAVVLRGTETLAVNLNGVTVGGGAFDISVEYTEDV
ncbi:MAG TPA: hypothetical protein VHV10_02350 [Ktedonobacteraceae bacterium]|jgi:hypothetical protein|nr:hypothetical protein [Ktedonobacteraceae bacterium]